MKCYRKPIYLLLVCVAIAVCTGGLVAIVPDQSILVGLQGVNVVVIIAPTAKEAGVTEGQIRTDVELKLRLAGIKVRRPGELPCLTVKVNAKKVPDSPHCILAMVLSVEEYVFLIRDPNIVTYAITWDKGYYGITGTSRIEKRVRETIKDMVDKFINDYLAANPNRK